MKSLDITISSRHADLSEALVATAAGLAAAIPAVIGYNHFLGRLRRMGVVVDEFIADFIHRIQGRRT